MILAREAIAVWEIQLALADTHTHAAKHKHTERQITREIRGNSGP